MHNDRPSFYWRLGGTGGAAADSSGNANPGVYGSTIIRGVRGAVTGTADTAISTPGNSAGIVSAAYSSSSPPVFSTELWFKTASTSGGKLIGFGNMQVGGSTNYDKHIYMGNDGRLRFGVYSRGAIAITTPDAYNDNAWHHVVAVQDAAVPSCTSTARWPSGARPPRINI